MSKFFERKKIPTKKIDKGEYQVDGGSVINEASSFSILLFLFHQ